MNRLWCVCLSHCISWQLPVYNWIKRRLNMMVNIICVCSFMYGVIPVYGTNQLLFIFCKSSFVQEEFVLFILEISWFTVSTKKNFTFHLRWFFYSIISYSTVKILVVALWVCLPVNEVQTQHSTRKVFLKTNTGFARF